MVERYDKDVVIRKTTPKRQCPIRHGLARFRNFVAGIAILGAVAVYAYPKIFKSVNSQLAAHVEKQLNVHLNRFGLEGKVENANFVEGKGIQITGLQMSCIDGRTIAGIERAFLHAPAQLPDLLAGNLKLTAVELIGATIYVTRDQRGKWDLQEILARIGKAPPPKEGPIPVIIRDSRIEIDDQFRTPGKTVLLSNLDVHVKPTAEDPNKIEAAGSIVGFQDGRFHFRFTPVADGQAHVDYRIANLPVNKTTLGFLPPGTRPDSIRAAIGLISGEGSVRFDASKKQFSQLLFQGELRQGSLDHASSPYLISKCRGPLSVSNDVISGELVGVLGTSGQFGQFRTEFQHHLLVAPQNWTATGTVRKLTINKKLARYFGKAVRRFFADFDPYGTVDVDFRLTHDKNGLKRELSADLLDMSFNFIRFPYPIQHATGKTTLINDEITFNVHAMEQGQPVGLSGTVTGNGPTAELSIDFWSEGPIPIDKKMRTAVAANDKIAKTIFDFRPGGSVKVYGQVRKASQDPGLTLNYDVELINCRAQHASFEYPIDRIDGVLLIRGNEVTIDQVVGFNGKSQVTCSGYWDTKTGLELDFDAYHVVLDQRLAKALNSDIRQAWNSINPSGIAHYAHVTLTAPTGQPLTVTVDSQLADPENPQSSNVEIEPPWFPYRLKQLQGRVEIADGKVAMTSVRGLHNKMWLRCNGNGIYDRNSWSLTLSDIMMASLSVDEDLLTAVPSALREALEGLNYQGTISGTGTVTLGDRASSRKAFGAGQLAQVNLDQNAEQSNNFFMDWNVRLEMDRGQMNVGVPIENIFGSVDLRGSFDGQSVQSAGSIAVDSLHLYGVQLTNVRGPLWIEDSRVGVGTLAKSDREQSTPLSLSGNLFGGTVRLDAQRWTDKEDRFFVQASLTNCDVKQAGRQLAPSLHEVGGTANLAVRLAGGTTRESVQGEGFFQLGNANIYELPVILSLLKMMKTRRRDRGAFDASNVEFTVSGDSIRLNRIELLGDAISLIGNGDMDLDRRIDLNFYSVVGRNQFHIPIISDLAKAGSQQIMWLKVDGTLDNPNARHEILPRLNESVRQLFQTDQQAPPRLEPGAKTSSTDMFRNN